MYGFPYFIKNKWFKEILVRSKERKDFQWQIFFNFLILKGIKDLRIFSKMKGSRGNKGKLFKHVWYVLSIWYPLFK